MNIQRCHHCCYKRRWTRFSVFSINKVTKLLYALFEIAFLPCTSNVDISPFRLVKKNKQSVINCCRVINQCRYSHHWNITALITWAHADELVKIAPPFVQTTPIYKGHYNYNFTARSIVSFIFAFEI